MFIVDTSGNYKEIYDESKFIIKVNPQLKLLIEQKLKSKEIDIEKVANDIAKDLLIEFKRIADYYLKDFSHIEQDNRKYTFYYDESFNNRVFRIKGNRFNVSLDEYFTIGGIVFKDSVCNTDTLFSQLELQNNNKELKARHVLNNKSKEFGGFLKSKNLNIFLKWIYTNDMYMHFTCIDNLYIFACEISNPLLKLDCEFDPTLFSFFLHNFAHERQEKVSTLLSTYQYPNVMDNKIIDFCNEWIALVNSREIFNTNDKEVSLMRRIEVDTICDCFDKLKGVRCFNRGASEDIIEDYSAYYMLKPIRFANSVHIFDEETEIQAALNNWSPSINGIDIRNYHFVNSKGSDKMIQISDVTVGLIAKFLSFIVRTLSINNINNLLDMDAVQKENLVLLCRILKKSYNENINFIHLIAPFSVMNTFDLIKNITSLSDKISVDLSDTDIH